jgi:hypothetical protein
MAEQILAINMVPEDGETGVPIEELVRLHVVSLGALPLDATTKVYITRGSEAIRRLVYDLDAGGFQTPYDGTHSTATIVQSPGSTVDDELWLQIDFTGLYTSLEVLLVEVYAYLDSGAYSYYHSYSFTIEDLTAPEVVELLWYDPWTCRVKFDEAVNVSTTTPGGSAYLRTCLGAAVVVGATQGDDSTQVQLPGTTLPAAVVGLMVQVAGSAYPQNNQPRPITAVDTTTGIVTVNTSTAWGGPLRADNGRDYDESGILVRERKLQACISPYYFTARLSEEGASEEALSAERVQCAYCPMPIAAQVATAAELKTGEDYRRYVTLTLEDDISLGRLYTLHVVGVEDVYGNATTDAQFDFQSPTFGAPASRLQIWANGLIPPPDRTEDMEQNKLLRTLAVVLQDAFNMLWYRVDRLQYLDDADRCPSEWVDHLLYNRSNPFRFELATEDQKRLLAASLPGFYRLVGTAYNIIDMVYKLTGLRITVEPFITGNYWRLGTSRLGLETILAPSNSWALNAYNIRAYVSLTAAQRRIIWDVAVWADPADMHLAAIIDPDDETPDLSYWILGTSALGLSTTLAG